MISAMASTVVTGVEAVLNQHLAITAQNQPGESWESVHRGSHASVTVYENDRGSRTGGKNIVLAHKMSAHAAAFTEQETHIYKPNPATITQFYLGIRNADGKLPNLVSFAEMAIPVGGGWSAGISPIHVKDVYIHRIFGFKNDEESYLILNPSAPKSEQISVQFASNGKVFLQLGPDSEKKYVELAMPMSQDGRDMGDRYRGIQIPRGQAPIAKIPSMIEIIGLDRLFGRGHVWIGDVLFAEDLLELKGARVYAAVTSP